MYYKRLNRLLSLRNIIIVGIITLIFTFFKLIYSGELNPTDSREPFHSVNKQHKSNLKHPKLQTFVIDDAADFVHQHKDSRSPLSVPRIAKYCNPPSGQPSGEEGLVPKDYVLISVHVVIRHGDRSPITKLPNGKHQDISCITDVSQYSHLPKVSNFVHVMAAATVNRTKDNTFRMWGMYPSHTVCADGQLTGQGAIQHVLNGIHYSERYRHQHRLFDETNWEHKVVAHSTEVSRTYQSAIAFLYGLLPVFEIEKINLNRASNIHFCENNLVGPYCNCLGLENINVRAGQECRAKKEYVAAIKHFKRLARHISNILDIEEHQLQWPTALMDGLSTFACHNIPFPCNANRTCLTSRDIEAVWEPVDFLSNCLNKNQKYLSFAKISMFGLLYRIAMEFKNAVDNVSGPRFHLYSGHDTTVSPLISALELQDGVWPGYATRIVFELYHRQSSQEHFFRVLQNGKVVTSEVVFCKGLTKNGFCSLAHFLDYFNSNNFEQMCHSAVSNIKPH
ncbi:2-phosphoxylose phosphatase 1 [Bulinus truncatus]|nr:2-phosphoxylose phosphatase 1 [Bulinus truncatus]